MSVTVKLSQPIEAHGEKIAEITLREPKGRDIAACGAPRAFIRRGKSLRMETNAEIVYDYIVMLGGIPPSSVDKIAAPDWQELTDAVLGFFAPAAPQEGSSSGGNEPAPAAGGEKKVKMPFQETANITPQPTS